MASSRVSISPELILIIAGNIFDLPTFLHFRAASRTIKESLDDSQFIWRMAYLRHFDAAPDTIVKLDVGIIRHHRFEFRKETSKYLGESSEGPAEATEDQTAGLKAAGTLVVHNDTGYRGWRDHLFNMLELTSYRRVAVEGRRGVKRNSGGVIRAVNPFKGTEGNEANALVALKALILASTPHLRMPRFPEEPSIDPFPGIEANNGREIARVFLLGASGLAIFHSCSTLPEVLKKAESGLDKRPRNLLKTSPLLSVIHLALASYHFLSPSIIPDTALSLYDVEEAVFWPRREIPILQEKSGFTVIEDGLFLSILAFWTFAWNKNIYQGEFYNAVQRLSGVHRPSLWTRSIYVQPTWPHKLESEEFTIAGNWFGGHAMAYILRLVRHRKGRYPNDISTSDLNFIQVYTRAEDVPASLRHDMRMSPVDATLHWVDQIFKEPNTPEKEHFLMSGSYRICESADPQYEVEQTLRRYIRVGHTQLLGPQYGSHEHRFRSRTDSWPLYDRIPEVDRLGGFRLIHFYQFEDMSLSLRSQEDFHSPFDLRYYVGFEGIVLPASAIILGRWYKPDLPASMTCSPFAGHARRMVDGTVSGPFIMWRDVGPLPHERFLDNAFGMLRGPIPPDVIGHDEEAFGHDEHASLVEPYTFLPGPVGPAAGVLGPEMDYFGRTNGINDHQHVEGVVYGVEEEEEGEDEDFWAVLESDEGEVGGEGVPAAPESAWGEEQEEGTVVAGGDVEGEMGEGAGVAKEGELLEGFALDQEAPQVPGYQSESSEVV